MNNETTDVTRLRAIVTAEYPPVNKQLLLIWKSEATMPILKKVIDEWIEVVDKKKPMIDMATYEEAMKLIGTPATMGDGGAVVGDVKSYFDNINFSALPPSAAVYIREQLLTDPKLAGFDINNETYQMVKGAIDSITDKKAEEQKQNELAELEKNKKDQPVAQREKKQEITPPVNLDAETKPSERDNLLQQISDYEGTVKYLTGAEKETVETAISDLKTALKYLPEEKATGGLFKMGVHKRPKSALMRDRKYTSQQEWELGYHRKGKKKFYKEEGGAAEEPFFDLSEEDISNLNNPDVSSVEYSNHWMLNKAGKEYEAIYDGLYMEVFKTLDDLIYRRNQEYYEYDAELSEKNDEETFVSAEGKKREYKKGGRLKSAINRDRKYTSQQEWEKGYERRGRRHFYHEEGGVLDTDLLFKGGTMADLKRKLELGTAIKLVNWEGKTDPSANKNIGVTRYVVKKQTNSVAFNADKNAKTGSWWEFPPASLVEITDKGFKVYAPGRRPLNAEEQKVWDNQPKNPEQDMRDLMSDGSVMFYLRKNYFQNAGYGYLYLHEWQGGKLYSNGEIIDKSIKGPLALEYEFVDERSGGGRAKQRPYAEGYKTIDGVKVVSSDEFDENPLFYVWTEYPRYKKLDHRGYLEYSYEYYNDKSGNKYLVISEPKNATDEELRELVAKANWDMARNVDGFVEDADKEEYERWLELISKDGGELNDGVKAYEAEIYFKDEPENKISGYLFKEGDSGKDDENIFFYVESENEMKSLMNEDNGQDFVVVSYEPTKLYKTGGRLKSAINRDRKYTSRQEWEKDYQRVGRRNFYKEQGGRFGQTSTTGFIVMNETDGIPASPQAYKTREEAQRFIDEFPKRYKLQGYYLTASQERIKPENVVLKIVSVDKMAKCSPVPPTLERMYGFLVDDLGELQKAIGDDDMEKVDKFFSYWGHHLKSLKTESNERMFNFLQEDLVKLQKAIADGNSNEVDIFFSYWDSKDGHLEKLKMEKKEHGGGFDENLLRKGGHANSLEIKESDKAYIHDKKDPIYLSEGIIESIEDLAGEKHAIFRITKSTNPKWKVGETEPVRIIHLTKITEQATGGLSSFFYLPDSQVENASDEELVKHLFGDEAQVELKSGGALAQLAKEKAVKAKKPRKKTEHIQPATNFDIRISKNLATALLDKDSELITGGDCEVYCKELGTGTDWAQFQKSDLVSHQIPSKYKTFEIWLTGELSKEDCIDKLNLFIIAKNIK